jgi:hypothetical protein
MITRCSVRIDELVSYKFVVGRGHARFIGGESCVVLKGGVDG